MTCKIFLALLLAGFWTFQPAHAQRSYDIMVEEGGRPLKRAPKAVEPPAGEVKKAPKRKGYPRGSSYIPPANLPRTEAIVTSPSPGVYKPPPINTFSDRVRNCIHSYPLNAGIGNNPTDQSSYVRQCAN
jgi:hypothetical protein